MTTLYYDCFAGISGDMNLGAMVDLGVDASALRAELEKLGLAGWELQVCRDSRRGISGTRVDVVTAHEHAHRTLPVIRDLIEASGLASAVKARSMAIFERLAAAEAKVHSCAVDEVHFHEVGAVDAIIDIVGAAVCHELLGVVRILAGPVELGSGTIRCAHGTMPVPAPATAELLLGAPVRLGGVKGEATTPTGAAILAASVDRFDEQPALTAERVAYGIGQRDPPSPNVLRVLLAAAEQGASGTLRDEIVVLECNLDDMSPEAYDFVFERLFEAGAVEAFLTPLIMKKTRPGVCLTALALPPQAAAVRAAVLRHTTTLGVRERRSPRTVLRRETRRIDTCYGPVRIKEAFLADERVRWKPEYEDCRRLAEANGVPLQEIYDHVRPDTP